MVPSESKHLIKWPTDEQGVSVDLTLRILGAEMQRMWLEKEAAGLPVKNSDPVAFDLYMARTEAIIGTVGLMACLRAFRAVDPAKAEDFARDYWSMCEAGDSFGELLWDFTNEAGLDPSLVTLTTE